MKKAIVIFVCCCFVAAFADNPHITKLIELVDVAISSPADGDTLTFVASDAKWENKSPTSVVARFSAINQTSSISQSLLYAVPAAGTFRISLNADMNAPAPTNPPLVTITWTDSFSNIQSLRMFAQPESTAVIQSGMSDISISVDSGTLPYSVFIVAEKL